MFDKTKVPMMEKRLEKPYLSILTFQMSSVLPKPLFMCIYILFEYLFQDDFKSKEIRKAKQTLIFTIRTWGNVMYW